MAFSRKEENLIALFRSLPTNKSRAILRKERSLGSIIEAQLAKLPITKNRPEEIIMNNWTSIVGEFAAHRCSPQKIIEGKKLIINVGNPTLRQELLFQKQNILSKLQSLPLCEKIEDILLIS